jgi:hypothetical protein
MLNDLGRTLGMEPSNQGRAGSGGDHDGGIVAQGLGCHDASDAGVSTRGCVEVRVFAKCFALSDSTEEVVADASGLEGTGGLQVVEF